MVKLGMGTPRGSQRSGFRAVLAFAGLSAFLVRLLQILGDAFKTDSIDRPAAAPSKGAARELIERFGAACPHDLNASSALRVLAKLAKLSRSCTGLFCPALHSH
eukprot:4232519-Pleurochrysis_carterae.AAC.2